MHSSSIASVLVSLCSLEEVTIYCRGFTLKSNPLPKLSVSHYIIKIFGKLFKRDALKLFHKRGVKFCFWDSNFQEFYLFIVLVLRPSYESGSL